MANEIIYEKLDKCILCDSQELVSFQTRLNLSKCRGCGLIFDNPRPTVGSISQYYSRKGKYDHWLQFGKRLDVQYEAMVRRIRKLMPGGELLDIGAGIGQFLSVAKRYYSVHGTELSSEAVSLAKQRFGIDLMHGEIESLNLAEDSYDFIMMSQILEHLPYPGITIDLCKKLLKKDGILYISVPNEAFYSLRMVLPSLFSMLGMKKYRSFSFGGFRKIDFDIMDEIHLSHFAEPTLKSCLLGKGFVVERAGVDFVDPLLFSKSLVVQAIRRVIYSGAFLLRKISGISFYNCFWIAVRKL